MIVYVDVLLIVNFMVNFILLRLTAQFSGELFSGKRAACGAFAGALSALIVFFPDPPFLGLAALRLGVSFVMVLIAFGVGKDRALPKLTMLLCLISCLFSGMMLAVSIIFEQDMMSVYHGVLYFDIGLPALLMSVTAAYFLSKLLSMLLWGRNPQGSQCRATIVTTRGSCTVSALIDTGNSLTEPFSGDPVLVCEKEALKGVLPMAMEKRGPNVPLPVGCRLVPYRTVGGKGVLEAFRPLCVRIESGQNIYRCERVYVAVSCDPIGAGSFCAVLNPILLSEGKREEAPAV